MTKDVCISKRYTNDNWKIVTLGLFALIFLIAKKHMCGVSIVIPKVAVSVKVLEHLFDFFTNLF